MNDATLNKLASIERCVKRIREVYRLSGAHFETDYTSQDSIILNLQRACEASIDQYCAANSVLQCREDSASSEA